MKILFVLLLILSSGSTLGLYFRPCTYEKMMPITCMTITMILFLFGIADALLLGVYVVLLLVAGLYIAFLFRSCTFIKCNGIKAYANRIMQTVLTPAAFLVVALFFLFTYINKGHIVMGWDEFSHWATVVKQMVYANVLGSSEKATYVLFKAYPPAMALLQYLAERVYLFLYPESDFCDWLLYFTYQIYLYSFVVFFLSFLDYKKPYSIVVSLFLIIAPTFVFSDSLDSIYIDSFLSLIAGAGMAAVAVRKPNDWTFDVFIFLTIATLILAKDAGLMFAAFLAIAYVFSLFAESRSITRQTVIKIACAVSAFLPKLLWSLNLKIQNTPNTLGLNVDLGELIRILLGRRPYSFRTVVAINFIKNFFVETSTAIFNYPLYLVQLLAFLFLGVLLIVRLLSHGNPKQSKFYKAMFCLIFVETIVYIFGLMVSYMYNFSVREALALASITRYLRIITNVIWMFVVLSLPLAIQFCTVSRTTASALALCLLLCSESYITINQMVGREPIQWFSDAYEPYSELFQKVQSSTEEDSAVFLIAQEDTGYACWASTYHLMPRTLNPAHISSIGKPFYEGDVFTCEMTAEQWQEILKESYDYVALFVLNDFFYDEFSCLFTDPDTIAPNCVYKVNKTSGTLELLA